MTSRSATVLVIFVIAIFAFCLASVFAAMTGPISILPNESESGGILDNLSALTDDTDNSYGYQDYNYQDYEYSDDDSSQIETTTVETEPSDSVEPETTPVDDGGNDYDNNKGGSDSSSVIETTTDD